MTTIQEAHSARAKARHALGVVAHPPRTPDANVPAGIDYTRTVYLAPSYDPSCDPRNADD